LSNQAKLNTGFYKTTTAKQKELVVYHYFTIQ